MIGLVVGALFWILVFVVRRALREARATSPEAGGRALLLSLVVYGVAFSVLMVFAPRAALIATVTLGILPHWLTWRVCLPLGLWRTGRVLLAVAPHAADSAFAGRQRLWDACCGRPLVRRPLLARFRRTTEADRWARLRMDAWTAAAHAVAADLAGRHAEADVRVAGLAAAGFAVPLPRTVTHIAADLLAERAARRGDWAAVARRASFGRGRGVRFLRLLARAHRQADVPRWMLVTAFVLAPRRASHRRLPMSIPAARPAGTAPISFDSPWNAHLAVLDAASRASPRAADVIALARAWEDELTPSRAARFRARALELGVREPSLAFDRFRRDVLGDLEALAAHATGAWNPSPEDGDGIVAELGHAFEDRLHARLRPLVAPWQGGGPEPGIAAPLQEWERWLELRSAVEMVDRRLGDGALEALWFGGLRTAAWNWPCRLLDAHDTRASWSSAVMFRWMVGIAERLGDADAAEQNRRNLAVACSRFR